MKTLLAGLNPFGIVGMAPYYLKSYYKGKVDLSNVHDLPIRGYDIEQEDLGVAEDICSESPDVVGISCYVWNIKKVLRVCEEIRRRLPDVKIVLGGPEVAPWAKKLMERHDALDVIAVGEGEVTFAELLEHYNGNLSDLADVQGIVYRDGRRLVTTPPRPVIPNLDDIPSPFLTGVVEFEKTKGYLFGYETFRGCPFTCSFCYWGRMQSVRYFPMERVEKELGIILSSSLKRMWLGDAVANLHRKRFKHFLSTVIANNTKTIIDFEMVADLLDDETIELLGQLNDGYIAFGLQSINDEALANITRRWNHEKFTTNVRKLRQRTDRIKIYIDLIYGLPGDTLETYEAGIRYAMSLLPQKIQPHPLLLLPGSPLYSEPEKWGIVYDEEAPHYVSESNTFDREQMAKAARWTPKIFFYFNPATNLTTIMLSQILREEPLDLFTRLHDFVAPRFDITLISSDIGLKREHATELAGILEEFIRSELAQRVGVRQYMAPLIDVMNFVSCRTMFHFVAAGHVGISANGNGNGTSAKALYPMLNSNVVLRRFSHDMGALYSGNLLRAPEELLRFESAVYDVVFNLETHSIYHVSEHVGDLLAGCSGGRTLEELVDVWADDRNLDVGEDSYSAIEETFNDLAWRQVVTLSGGRANA